MALRCRVSPDARVRRVLDRASARAVVVLAAESAAVGAAVAAWSMVAGLATALLFAAWRSRWTTRRAVVAMLERGLPQSHNVLVTADELASGVLHAKPNVRERIAGEAAAIAESADLAALIPSTRAGVLALCAITAWGVAFAIHARSRSGSIAGTSQQSTALTRAVAPKPTLRVAVTLVPPSYTGLPSSTATDPAQLRLLEHSEMRLAIETT